MKVDGIWSVEIAGLEGWDRIATCFMKDERYFDASADHYSVGSYKVTKEKFKASVRVFQYGQARAIFGSKAKKMDVVFEGKIKEKGKISGRSFPASGSKFDVKVRMKRLGKLD